MRFIFLCHIQINIVIWFTLCYFFIHLKVAVLVQKQANGQIVLLRVIISFIVEDLKGFSLEYYGIISEPKTETALDHKIELPVNRSVVVNVNALEIAVDPECSEESGGM